LSEGSPVLARDITAVLREKGYMLADDRENEQTLIVLSNSVG